MMGILSTYYGWLYEGPCGIFEYPGKWRNFIILFTGCIFFLEPIPFRFALVIQIKQREVMLLGVL
jgi:hypothetical protein